MARTWDYLTKTAKTDTRLTPKNRATFHCFNPNGLYEKLKDVQGRVSQWCKDHPDRPNGVLFVHGSLNDYPRKTLFAALEAKRDIRREVNSAVNIMFRAILDAEAFLADENQWPKKKEGES